MSDRYPNDWNSRRRRVLRRDNYTCQNCGSRGGSHGNAELHIHHSVPISSGGSHQISNLITHCKDCHDAIHGNRMAPTASTTGTGEAGVWMQNIEPPSFGETFITMLWWTVFGLATVTFGPIGSILIVGMWVCYKYMSRGSNEKQSHTSTPIQSTNSTFTSNVPSSVEKPVSRYTNYDEYEPSWSSGEDDNPNQDSSVENDVAPGDTNLDVSEPEQSATESATSNEPAPSKSDRDAPFSWYGDETVDVNTVLNYIDTDIDQETQEYIKRSVENHRRRDQSVDAADIRWVAEASEKLDIEQDHPF